MVTAELAACLPVLVLVLGVAISALTVVAARVRAQDAAREAARAAGRGDAAAAQRLVAVAAPGAELVMSRGGGSVSAVVRVRIRPWGSWLPALTVSERSVAAAEPRAASP